MDGSIEAWGEEFFTVGWIEVARRTAVACWTGSLPIAKPNGHPSKLGWPNNHLLGGKSP